jgi:hypothetical protein
MFGYGESEDLLKQQAEQGKAMEKTMEMGQNPGSIYVHDTHVEKVLEGIRSDLAGLESIGPMSVEKATESIFDFDKIENIASILSPMLGTIGNILSLSGFGEQAEKEKSISSQSLASVHVGPPGGLTGWMLGSKDDGTSAALEGVLKDLEAVKSLADPSKYTNEFMGIVAKVQQEGLQTNDIIAKANASIAPVLPTSIDASAWDPIKSVERNPEFIKAMSGLENDIINAGGGELIPSATSTSGLEDFLLKTQVGLENKAATLTTPVGHHAVPMLRPEGESDVGAVQPVHLEGITSSILRNKAGSQSEAGKLPVKELAGIEEASNEQVDQLILVRDAINKLVDLMTPRGSVIEGGGGAGPGSNKDPRTPIHAAIFGNTRYGRVGDSANRSLVNNGRC